jgi:tRNA A37 threonylcarbamoyladenosine dehydratase
VPVNPFFQRLALVTGEAVLGRLEKTHVHVFGLGGVGSWTAEALVRSGIGRISIIDSDLVCVTNINRQVEATSKTIGEPKTEALMRRLLEINPGAQVTPYQKAFSRETAECFGFDDADYVIDAIDSLTHKVALIEETAKQGKTLFSCMGMAQKLDPTQIRTASVWETCGCPLARLVRQELRKRDFQGDFTAVYSPERLPLHTEIAASCGNAACMCPKRESGGDDSAHEWCLSKKVINGSAVTVTATAGMVLASLVLAHAAQFQCCDSPESGVQRLSIVHGLHPA